jgi:hypothetical protein
MDVIARMPRPYRRGAYDLNKFVAPRPYADPNAAARKIIEIANSVQVVRMAESTSRRSTGRCCSS